MNLPNPAMVLRGLANLTHMPKPSPVAEDDWRLGTPDAPIVLIEYGDYQCTHCAELHAILEGVTRDYRDKLLLVHRHFPLRHSHPQAQLAAEAAEAAGALGKFWEMHHQLFLAKLNLEKEKIVRYAEELGLDKDKFLDDLNSGRFKRVVDEEFDLARSCRVKFVPTFFVNGILWEGPLTRESICSRIDGLLACV
jgi:protein-disulfide isomerase